MERIEQINLLDAVAEAEALAKQDAMNRVVSVIRHLLGEAHSAAEKVERLQRDLEKALAVREKVLDQLMAVRHGDWSRLPEPKGEESKKGNAVDA